MIPKEHLVSFSKLTTIESAAVIALNSYQEVFTVVNEDTPLGIVTKNQIIQAAATNREDYIRSLVDTAPFLIELKDSLTDSLPLFEQATAQTLIVVDDQKFAGLVSKKQATESILFQNIIRKSKEDKMDFF